MPTEATPTSGDTSNTGLAAPQATPTTTAAPGSIWRTKAAVKSNGELTWLASYLWLRALWRKPRDELLTSFLWQIVVILPVID